MMKHLLFVFVFVSSFLQAAFDIKVTIKNILQKNEHSYLVCFRENEREKIISLHDNGLQLYLKPSVINKNRISIKFELSRDGSEECFLMPCNFVVCELGKEGKIPFEGTCEGNPYELCFVASKDIENNIE